MHLTFTSSVSQSQANTSSTLTAEEIKVHALNEEVMLLPWLFQLAL
jgi:hypothetical protein